MPPKDFEMFSALRIGALDINFEYTVDMNLIINRLANDLNENS
jgi:hypothetical protein